MRWRTEGHPDDGTLCFCEILHRGKYRPYVLRWVNSDKSWSALGIGFDSDETDRWCPVDEIIEAIDKETQSMDLFYNKIDFFCYEKEPNVIVITPEGTRLVSTNDPAVFTYVRLVIKKNNLKGYKVVTDDGEIHDILPNGKIRDYPEGKLPGDVYGKFLLELM